jgi:hypothetical protein
MRLARLMPADDSRACHLLTMQVIHMLEVAWGKDWAEIARYTR